MRKLLCWIFMVGMFLTGFTYYASAQSVPLEQLLPSQTIFYVTFPNLKATREALQKTALGDIINEPQVQKFWEKIKEEINNKISENKNASEFKEKFKKDTGIDISEIPNIFLNGQISLALIDFEIKKEEPLFDLVFALEYGQKREEILKIIEFIKKEEQQFKPQSVEYKNTQIWNMDGKLQFVLCQDTLYVTTKLDRIKNIIDLLGTKSGTLPSHSYFKAVMSKVKLGQPNFFVYLNIEKLLASLASVIPQEVAPILDTLGVHTMKALGGGSCFVDKGVKEVFHLHIPGIRKGLTKILSFPQTNLETLQFVPFDAMSFSATNIEFANVWKEIRTLAEEISPDAPQMIDQTFEELKQQSGIDGEKLINSFGPEIGLYYKLAGEISQNDPGKMFKLGVILELKDPNFVESSVERFIERNGIPINKEDYKGRRIRTIKMGGPASNITFCYCFAKKWLFFTFPSEEMIRLIEDYDAKKVGLESKKDFIDSKRYISLKYSGLSYTDMRKSIGNLYDTIMPIIKNDRYNKDKLFPVDLLPDKDTIARHLFGMVTGFISDESGLTAEVYSPLGNIYTMALGGGIGAALLLPALNQVRSKAEQTKCKTNLKQIGMALHMYYAEKGAYPDMKDPDFFHEIYPYLNEPSCYRCPCTGNPPATAEEFQNKSPWISDYEVRDTPITSADMRKPGQVPVVWDKEENHADERCVLFLDGHVESMPERMFQLRVRAK